MKPTPARNVLRVAAERFLLMIATVAVLGGCAGRDFVRPSPESLQLGKTTYDEIVTRFGKPYVTGAMQRNNHKVTMASYAYSTTGGEPLMSGATPARATGFYFLDSVLIGHEFTSSYRSDHTDFDETRIGQIKEGSMSESQVIALMGPPTGRYIYPLIQNKSDNALVYLYSQTRQPYITRVHQYLKILVVSVGPDGVVSDVTFTTTGER